MEFDFDLSRDTAISVAGEMVEDLQLSPEDAAAIVAAIKAEVEHLSTQLTDKQVSSNLMDAAEALQQTLRENAASQASDSGLPVAAQEQQEPEEASPPTTATLSQIPAAALLAARAQGSGVSLASDASASSSHSAPHSATAAAAAPAAAAGPATGIAPDVAAPPRVFSPPPHFPPAHPPLPPHAVTAGGALPDFPSPSLRVMRSSSIDAAALLRGEPFSRSSSAAHGEHAPPPPRLGINRAGLLQSCPDSGVNSM